MEVTVSSVFSVCVNLSSLAWNIPKHVNERTRVQISLHLKKHQEKHGNRPVVAGHTACSRTVGGDSRVACSGPPPPHRHIGSMVGTAGPAL